AKGEKFNCIAALARHLKNSRRRAATSAGVLPVVRPSMIQARNSTGRGGGESLPTLATPAAVLALVQAADDAIRCTKQKHMLQTSFLTKPTCGCSRRPADRRGERSVPFCKEAR